MLNQETAKAARTDSGYILRAPRRMRVPAVTRRDYHRI